MIAQGYILLSMLTGSGTLKSIFTDFLAFLAGLRSQINVCSNSIWQIEKQSNLYMQYMLPRSSITVYITKSNLSTTVTRELVRLNI